MSSTENLRDLIEEMRAHLGYVEGHHGDALTDFGTRLAAIEEKHGRALVDLGMELQNLKAQIGRGREEQPRAPGWGTSSYPPGTFLGDIPGRYGEQLARYRAQGGRFDVSQNTIRYGHGDLVRFYALSMAFDLLEKDGLEGDIVELGVYQGDTAAIIAARGRALGKSCFFLDTYEGFDDRDLEQNETHLSGAFAQTSLEAVRARVGTELATFIKGYFPQTAAKLPADGRYCLVHIDTDLYAPILAGLEYFYQRLVPGGFLIIHDYMSLSWDGAIRAVDEFFADKPEFIVPIPDLAGSVVIRKCAHVG